MFTSKRIQDPLQYDLFVPSTKTVSKGKHSAKYHQAARFFRDVLRFNKKWKLDCKCKLCKDYIQHVGCIQIAE